MMRWLISWVFGEWHATFPRCRLKDVTDALYRSGIRYYETGRKNSDAVCLAFSRADKEKASAVLDRVKAEYQETETGLPALLHRYRHRPGIIVGTAILALSLGVSQLFIWRVDLNGLGGVNEDDVRALLASYGIFEGAYRPSLDPKKIYNELLIETEDFCWISVNIRGTVANVELRPFQKTQEMAVPKGKYANIVATHDGEIELIEANSGSPVVKIGQPVRKGDLLVSGISETGGGRVSVGYASGKVYAKVHEDFEVSVPLTYMKILPTERAERDLELKIFNKTIKVFNNSRKTEKEYGIIKESDLCRCTTASGQLGILGVRLPVRYRMDTFTLCVSEQAERSETDAKTIADAMLSRKILDTVGDGALLSVESESELTEDAYVIRGTLYVSRNIAEIREFECEDG